MSASDAASHSLPLRNCYWVVPGLLLAGEHPNGPTRDKTKDRLKKLLDAGIECFVDLTKPTELLRYDTFLPFYVEYARKSIKDHGIPGARSQMVEILEHIANSMRAGRPVYVHCRAGIGRTGTVVGCLLAERGMQGQATIDELNRLWQQCRRSRSWPFIPETDAQARYVREWEPALDGGFELSSLATAVATVGSMSADADVRGSAGAMEPTGTGSSIGTTGPAGVDRRAGAAGFSRVGRGANGAAGNGFPIGASGARGVAAVGQTGAVSAAGRPGGIGAGLRAAAEQARAAVARGEVQAKAHPVPSSTASPTGTPGAARGRAVSADTARAGRGATPSTASGAAAEGASGLRRAEAADPPAAPASAVAKAGRAASATAVAGAGRAAPPSAPASAVAGAGRAAPPTAPTGAVAGAGRDALPTAPTGAVASGRRAAPPTAPASAVAGAGRAAPPSASASAVAGAGSADPLVEFARGEIAPSIRAEIANAMAGRAPSLPSSGAPELFPASQGTASPNGGEEAPWALSAPASTSDTVRSRIPAHPSASPQTSVERAPTRSAAAEQSPATARGSAAASPSVAAEQMAAARASVASELATLRGAAAVEPAATARSSATAVQSTAAARAVQPPVEQPADSDPLLDPDTLAAARGLRERFLGTMFGLAVGDAVAAATQFRRPGTFPPIGDMLGGGPFDLPRGAYSDDTAMALCLAESLLERDGFDARDQVQRYSRWQQDGYLSSTGQCVGITANTARSLALAKWRRGMVFPGSHDPEQLDPEPLSRIASIALFYFASLDSTQQQAVDSCRITCQAPAVLDACRRLSRALNTALAGQPKGKILTEGGPIDEATVQVNNTAAAALNAAFWAFSSTDNFRDAVLRAANVGGNSDVVATVAGQLAGAHYGASAIPAPWRSGLIQKDLIEGIADRMLAHGLVSLSS